MTTKKSVEEKLIIKQGRSNSNVIWIGLKAYQITEGDVLMFGGGGIEVEEETELVKAFIKRNKKSYFKYEIIEPKEYNELIPIGKFKGQTVSYVFGVEKKYLSWMLKEYKFSSAQKNLEEQIKEILKT